MTSVLKQTLQLRRVAIDTYKENVAYLHRDCHIYRSEGFQALSKVEVNGEGGSRPVLAVLNVVDDDGITTPEQLGLSEDAFEQLGLAEGAAASVAHARPPASLHAIHRKIAGQRLDYPDYEVIVADDSTDETTRILNTRWASHPRLRIWHPQNRSGVKEGAPGTQVVVLTAYGEPQRAAAVISASAL